MPVAGVSTELSPEITAWIEETTAGALVRADRVPGGGRREAWLIDIREPSGAIAELFLRLDWSDPTVTGDPFTLHREARFYRALEDSEVPVPRVRGVHPRLQAILSERVPGKTWFSQLTDEGARESVARDFIGKLAAWHRLDARTLDVPGAETSAPLPEHVRRDLDLWERLYRHGDVEPDPMIEFGLRWLRANVPVVTGPVVLVQGDTGPGNFLYADGRVTAVLDWELAHLGDPMDDIAWLSLRAVQEPFTNLADRLAEYTSLSGQPIDVDRVRFYRVFAEVRIVILGHRKGEDQKLDGEVGNGLIYGALHRRLLAEALADVTGMAASDEPSLAAEATEQGWLYDAALVQLSDVVVPRSTDPFVVARSKGLARVIKYLREVDRLGARCAARECEDIATLLGSRPADVAEGRGRLSTAVVEGTVDDESMLRYVSGRVARETQLMRPAMGRLADRHYDAIA